MKVGAAARASHVNLLKYCNLIVLINVFPDSENETSLTQYLAFVQPRVHNTLQRVSNANYHCTNTLGKVT